MTLATVTDRQTRRNQRRWAARNALFVDMLKSYAAPLVLAAYIVPALNQSSDAPRLGAANHALLVVGLAMMGLALMLVRERE